MSACLCSNFDKRKRNFNFIIFKSFHFGFKSMRVFISFLFLLCVKFFFFFCGCHRVAKHFRTHKMRSHACKWMSFMLVIDETYVLWLLRASLRYTQVHIGGCRHYYYHIRYTHIRTMNEYQSGGREIARMWIIFMYMSCHVTCDEPDENGEQERESNYIEFRSCSNSRRRRINRFYCAEYIFGLSPS